jgi:hypothetical protein
MTHLMTLDEAVQAAVTRLQANDYGENIVQRALDMAKLPIEVSMRPFYWENLDDWNHGQFKIGIKRETIWAYRTSQEASRAYVALRARLLAAYLLATPRSGQHTDIVT